MEPPRPAGRLLVWMTMPWPAEIHQRPAPARWRSGGGHLRALVSCDAVSEELPLVVDGSRRPSLAMAEHLRTCLVCQAELSGYRRLLRVLRSLKEEPAGLVTWRPDLVGETLDALQRQLSGRQPLGRQPFGRRRRRTDPWVLAGALAVGFAACGAGLLAARARGTRVLTSPAI